MTVTSELNRKTYVGDAATTSFDTNPVVFFDDEDLTVYVVTTATGEVVDTLVLNTDYTVTGGDGAVGTVDTSAGSSPYGAPTAAQTLVIVRDLEIVQESDFVQNDGSDAEVAEDALDRLTMIAQQHKTLLERTVRLPDSDVTGESMEIPAEEDRASKVLGFDANGGLTVYDAGSTVTVASNVTYTAEDTDAGTVAGALSDICINVKQPPFNAACDDSTDDTAAVQAAIDSIGTTAVSGRSGPKILIPGPCRITDTLTIRRKAITFTGTGWGHRDDTGDRGSYLRWDGVAGGSMLKLSDNYGGCVIRDIGFKGNASAKPGCAIEFNETADSQPNEHIVLDHVRIGGFAGETGPADGEQFTDGILFSGTAVNNSEHSFRDVLITGCSGVGYKQTAIQHVNHNIDHLTIKQCGTGMQICGQAIGSNWNFSNCDVDIITPLQDSTPSSVNAFIKVKNYYSENAGRMAEFNGVARFVADGGQFQLTSDLNADGKVVKHEGNNALNLTLRDFRITEASSPPTAPYLSLRSAAAGASDKYIVLDGMTGWAFLTGGTNGLDVATRGVTDRAYVYFREHPQASGSNPIRVSQNFLHGLGVDWDINKFDVRNNTALEHMDDFIGDVLADQWGNHIGSNGSISAPAVQQIHGGVCRFTTGADAGGTMALNGAQLESNLQWSSQFGGLTIEARLRVSGVTDVAVFFGFTDQISALEMPFTLGAADALTSNASDAVGWLFDTGADTDNWWLVGVDTDVDATAQNSALAPAANTFEVLRIEVSSAGVATFWRNGKQIGSAMTAALTPTVNLTPVVAAFSRGAATRNVDVDYIHVQSNRWLP